MADNTLKDFYNYVACGEFDKALEMTGDWETFGEDKERIVIQALKLKKILQNSGCLRKV